MVRVDISDEGVRILYGVSAQLFAWLEQGAFDPHSIQRRAVLRGDVSLDRFLYALSERQIADRRRMLQSLAHAVWSTHPGFGPFPVITILSKMEDERSFYDEYRDHTSHQFLVYLLGLYLYSGCERLRAALLAEIRAEGFAGNEQAIEDEFVKRWTMASLAHDAGYIFECDQSNPAVTGEHTAAWVRAHTAVQRLWTYPLSHDDKADDSPAASAMRAEEGALNQLLAELKVPTGKDFVNARRLGTLLANDSDVLLDWDSIVARTGLRSLANVPHLRSYYEFAAGHIADGRKQCFIDHGIAGSLLLWETWNVFTQKCAAVMKAGSSSRLILQSWADKVREIESHQTRGSAVRAAAIAIALHNINRDIWKNNAGDLARSVSLSSYSIKLDSDNGTALAFMLALCDTLQDWDRPKFRPRLDRDREEELTDADLSIVPAGGKIRLFFRQDNVRAFDSITTEDTFYSRLVRRLKAYLDAGAVQQLVELDREQYARKPRLQLGRGFEGMGQSPDEAARIRIMLHPHMNVPPFSYTCDNAAIILSQACRAQQSTALLIAELSRYAEACRETDRIYAELAMIAVCAESYRQAKPSDRGWARRDLRFQVSSLISKIVPRESWTRFDKDGPPDSFILLRDYLRHRCITDTSLVAGVGDFVDSLRLLRDNGDFDDDKLNHFLGECRRYRDQLRMLRDARLEVLERHLPREFRSCSDQCNVVGLLRNARQTMPTHPAIWGVNERGIATNDR